MHGPQSREADHRHLTIHLIPYAGGKNTGPSACGTLPIILVRCARPAGPALTPEHLASQNPPSSLRHSLREPVRRPSPHHLLQPTNGYTLISTRPRHTTTSIQSMHPGHRILSLHICCSGANIPTTPSTMLIVGLHGLPQGHHLYLTLPPSLQPVCCSNRLGPRAAR